ncbi:MAG: DUF4301 family protein [Bacteroidales bacterium]|nr:DUF4301 family protein [Bacteroidales bacterium]
MLSEQQLQQIQARGVAVETFETQLENFKKGFPYLTIEAAATPAKGIKVLSEAEQAKYISVAENYGGNVCKFVPASGAATRMFKDLFEASDKLAAGEKLAEGSPAAKFVENISLFPFFDAQNILKLTLYPKAWNYGAMPKGLIQFHKYENENRTPFEEHLVEGALYAKDANGDVRMVVTVSVEHQQGFEELYAQVKKKYEKRFNCKYHVTFTNQQPSTDIVAVDMDNNPFTKDDGSLLFRPGGHGALLANLNDIDADVLVIKNIDNVVKESLLDETIRWKKILVGKATELQAKVFAYLQKMDELQDNLPDGLAAEIKGFLADEFCVAVPDMPADELVKVLRKKLDRPVRVCGMVKNEGEPGGGPYVILGEDGTTSLQILEAAQIDKNNPQAFNAMQGATHFNPVDLVCAVKNYKGEKYDLLQHTDPQTGFISEKSFQGRPLKAQELPGLWNGAMSDWNTQFVETPLITFNPVKTVLDLLREQHCNR